MYFFAGYSDTHEGGRRWKFWPILAFGLVSAAVSGHFRPVAGTSEQNNYDPRDDVDAEAAKTTRDASAKHNKRFGWLKVKPLWMDIERTCFARTCVAPYAVQLISIETTINHTAMFDMDIDSPTPPVDMYFPTPPSKTPRPLRKSESENLATTTTANFSVALFGVDPTYRFPRHCHSMIQNSATFVFEPIGRNRRLPVAPPPSIISFGADCLNLTFQIFVIPALPETNSVSGYYSEGQNELGPDAVDNLNLLGIAASSDTSLTVRTPVPMWIVAILAGVNAALLFAVIALVWHVALSARKKRNKRLRRQRSSAGSSATTTTNSYVPCTTTPMNRRITPPLPPPPMRPPPSRGPIDADQQEPKYDIPWTEGKYERTNGENDYKITFNTLQHKRDPQFFNYYFTADVQHAAPVNGNGVDEINSNDRPKPIRRTTTPATATIR